MMAAVALPARDSKPAPAPASVQQTIDTLLDSPSPPTATVTGSDALASAVCTAAAQRGGRIVSDLAVTGFDASNVGRLRAPALTTLAIPISPITDRLIARALTEPDEPAGAPGELVVPELVLAASG